MTEHQASQTEWLMVHYLELDLQASTRICNSKIKGYAASEHFDGDKELQEETQEAFNELRLI